MTVAAHAARTALLGLALVITLAACTAPDPTGPTVPTPPFAEASSELPRASTTPDSSIGTTAIRVVVEETVLQATLWDNPATRSLLDQLPLTLTLKDFERQEKISTLPHALSMDGMPTGDDPEPLDIGYYAPDGVLVFYYADVGYFNGIARLGHFDAPIDTLVGLADGATVTIELAP
jgi:hypothetical protein